MRVLPVKKLTPEQLTIQKDANPGHVLIRGAAGSGKTTAAIARLGQVCAQWSDTLFREHDQPLRALVLTFNTTLKSYISELIADSTVLADVDVFVDTFAKWAIREIGAPLVDGWKCETLLNKYAEASPLDTNFLVEEVKYVLQRFDPESLDEYVTARRTGRGTSPRIDYNLRHRILDEVIAPYQQKKLETSLYDWNDQAVYVSKAPVEKQWDVVIVDEAQDFTANQIRAIQRHLAARSSVTYIMDDTQRIYLGFFTWREAGVELAKTFSLNLNYRNTKQIARLAGGIVDGLPVERDGAIPDGDACAPLGDQPTVVSAVWRGQVDFACDQLRRVLAQSPDNVAFLFPKHKLDAADYLRTCLQQSGIDWSDLTRVPQWPTGDRRVAISTIHSAKGLEFDHVVILGLDHDTMPGDTNDRDDLLETHRRLLAMGIGRARKSVTVGLDPGRLPVVADYLHKGAYRLETV